MEQNKDQSSQQQQSGNMKNNGTHSDVSNQKMQHRSDVVNNNTENGNDNPQDGEDWSNYRNRSLSDNAEQQQKK